MAKFKIKKDLTDADMLKGYKEETFADKMMAGHEGEVTRSVKTGRVKAEGVTKDAFYREFFTEKMESQIGKLLLAVKMDYFKDGYGDFSIQVKRDGMNIVLETAHRKRK